VRRSSLSSGVPYPSYVRIRNTAKVGVAACLLALVLPANAGAAYGNGESGESGADLVSADYGRLEQGDDATQFAAVSADGRYVAIQTRARNFFADDDPDPPGQYRSGGIFRFDLESRRIELVAYGDLRDETTNATVRRGAQNPSIDGDGRFIAFSTAQQLVPGDANGNVDVYVRDMEVAIGAAGAFDLISARDGGNTPASYGPVGTSLPGGDPGAEVARGAAISHDGSKVVFRTTEPASDLPDRAGIESPGFQVFVRDRDADTTTLVTQVLGSGAPAGGAIGPAGISGDGSTVVWTGQNAPLQTAFVSGESEELPGFSYYLWRRVGDGPSAPTRRITGVSDPEDPGCAPSGPLLFDEFTTGPCFGPLGRPELGISANFDLLPAISADGRTVAFLTNSGPRPNLGSGIGLDLFVTEMSPGLTRKETTIELTREGGGATAESAPLETVAISPDGRYLAVTTARTKFTLPALAQSGEPRTVADAQELYVIDLEARTVERATRSFSGGDINSPVTSEASLSSDGSRIAFVSFAGNLFFGDANQRPDAFVVTRQPDVEGGSSDVGLRDEGTFSTLEFERGGPQIGVRARSRPGGEVVLLVSVPAAGGLKAVARAGVGEPRKPRALANETARARGDGRSEVRILLRPVDRYLAELRERGEIRGRVSVGYVASRGGRRASASVGVVFRARLTKRPTRRQAGLVKPLGELSVTGW